LDLCFPGVKPIENKTDWFLEFPNGSQIWIGGLDDKNRTEKILGNEYCTIFVNESSQISYESYSMLLTRLAQNTKLVNRMYIDCNPPATTHWLYKLFIKCINPDTEKPLNKDMYSHMRLNPDDNADNLPGDYIDSILGTLSERQQKRFRYGEFLDDIEGALWTWDMIERYRVNELPELVRVCIPVDPAVTANDSSDETGIIPVAKGVDGHFYIIGDYTGKYTPEDTARRISVAYDDKKADIVVGETNNGGDYIETVLKLVGGEMPYIGVHASRGKFTRAEPIALLYSQGRVHHYGRYPKLEEEMTAWTPNTGMKSPNRIDALVWGLVYLLDEKPKKVFSVI
jgi:phage terminase large subunit-like protein